MSQAEADDQVNRSTFASCIREIRLNVHFIEINYLFIIQLPHIRNARHTLLSIFLTGVKGLYPSENQIHLEIPLDIHDRRVYDVHICLNGPRTTPPRRPSRPPLAAALRCSSRASHSSAGRPPTLRSFSCA